MSATTKGTSNRRDQSRPQGFSSYPTFQLSRHVARSIRLLAPCSVGLFLMPSVSSAAPPPFEPAINLNILWEYVSGTDYTTTVDPAERDANSPFLGLFYTPKSATDASGKNSLIGVQPLYRLSSSSGTDHMDSLTSGEGGYQTQKTLGYAWTQSNAQVGLSPIYRMYNAQAGTPGAGDHATTVEASPLPHPQNLAYYQPDGPLGYAYARYPGTDNALAWQTGGGITIKSNLAVGCALWEWWWNGVQFVNDYDYGRQIQISLYPGELNPVRSALDEAGDTYGGPSIPVDARHPSPCVSFSTGVSSTGPYQTTATVPLEYFPAKYDGGSNTPIIYPSVLLGKTITLDWIGPDNTDRQWPVALFETRISSPVINPGTVEAPTGYLTSQFNNYFSYNPAAAKSSSNPTQQPTATVYCYTYGNLPDGSQNNPPCPTSGYNQLGLPAGPQAVILSSGTSPTSTAMGIYINDVNAAFVLYDSSYGTSGGQFGSNYAKWEVNYYSGINVNSSPWTFKTWIITGPMQNVIADIDQLYAWGVTSR